MEQKHSGLYVFHYIKYVVKHFVIKLTRCIPIAWKPI